MFEMSKDLSKVLINLYFFFRLVNFAISWLQFYVCIIENYHEKEAFVCLYKAFLHKITFSQGMATLFKYVSKINLFQIFLIRGF